MTSPTVSAQLEIALDELDMAHNTMTTALDDAKAIGLVPFRFMAIQHAIDDTLHACRELKSVVHALKLAYPDSPL